MFIEKIRLENFARYVDETVLFRSGFNAIIGSTDVGKSTILRALVWVLYNQPRGSDMRRSNTAATQVTLWTDTGHEVTRHRSDKRNSYILDGQSYDAVGTGLPKEVEDALGIRVLELGSRQLDMLTVSRQMDGPFLLSSSGSESAKILGSLSGIETIDKALSGIRPDLTDVSTQLKSIERAEKNYSISVTEFKNLQQEELDIKELSGQVKAIREKSSRIDSLRRVLDQIIRYNDNQSSINDRLKNCSKKTGQYTFLLEDLQPIIEKKTKLDNLASILSKINTYNAKHNEVRARTTQTEEEALRLSKRHDELLEKMGLCPTCGAKTRH